MARSVQTNAIGAETRKPHNLVMPLLQVSATLAQPLRRRSMPRHRLWRRSMLFRPPHTKTTTDRGGIKRPWSSLIHLSPAASEATSPAANKHQNGEEKLDEADYPAIGQIEKFDWRLHEIRSALMLVEKKSSAEVEWPQVGWRQYAAVCSSAANGTRIGSD
jgi:hypothetical protein